MSFARSVLNYLSRSWLTMVVIPAGSEADDNAVVRDYLSATAKEDLSQYSSEETEWHNREVRRKKQAGFKWKEEFESWVWLDDPDRSLSLQFPQFDVVENKVSFRMEASGKAKAKLFVKVPKIVKGETKATSNVHVVIEGEATFVDGKFQDIKIPTLKGNLSDLRFNNDLLKAVQGDAERCANSFLKERTEDLQSKIIKALEKVSI